MRIYEVVSTKPATPEQARIKVMQAQVKQAQQRVKAERLRQQQVKLNQQRSKLAGMWRIFSKEKTHCVATVGWFNARLIRS